jgi:hypothetical protein
MRLTLGNKWSKGLRDATRGTEFHVGILKDGPHRDPLPKEEGLANYLGGPVRKKSRKSSDSMSEVSASFREFLGFNFYTKPFTLKTNKEILKMSREFIKLISAAGGKINGNVRLRNMAQAIVRNPLLRGDYGSNSRTWAKEKGFNRLGFDTGQLFKAITAKVISKR